MSVDSPIVVKWFAHCNRDSLLNFGGSRSLIENELVRGFPTRRYLHSSLKSSFVSGCITRSEHNKQ